MRSEDSSNGESEEEEEAGRKYVVKYIDYSIVTSCPIIIFRKSIYITLCFRSRFLAS